ncbi:MAG TPA: diacylglycerol kinase family protein [Polyangiaceae bacterium]|nr:diacylglycerol kinase family protein [Polyangiaceae bacterium]
MSPDGLRLQAERLSVAEQRPGKMALLVNPNTTTGPRDSALIQKIAVRLGVQDVELTCPDDPGGALAIDRWHRQGIQAIAVIGGDGTLRNVLNALHQSGKTRDFHIVLLDGGSLGVVARMLGARDAWRRVLPADEQSSPLRYRAIPLPTLATEGGLGFVVAAGAGASVSRDFQQNRRTRSELLSYITTRVWEAARGVDNVSLLDGYHGALAFDGAVAPAKHWIAMFVTSLPQFGGRTPREVWEAGHLHSLGFRFKPKQNTVPRLRDVFAGRWTSETRKSREIRFDSPRPFDVILDGEVREQQSLTIHQGPTFQAWVPLSPRWAWSPLAVDPPLALRALGV